MFRLMLNRFRFYRFNSSRVNVSLGDIYQMLSRQTDEIVNRLRTLVVRKMISSMTSFSWICHCASFFGRKSFFSMGVLQGFWIWASKLLRIKLKTLCSGCAWWAAYRYRWSWLERRGSPLRLLTPDRTQQNDPEILPRSRHLGADRIFWKFILW